MSRLRLRAHAMTPHLSIGLSSTRLHHPIPQRSYSPRVHMSPRPFGISSSNTTDSGYTFAQSFGRRNTSGSWGSGSSGGSWVVREQQQPTVPAPHRRCRLRPPPRQAAVYPLENHHCRAYCIYGLHTTSPRGLCTSWNFSRPAAWKTSPSCEYDRLPAYTFDHI